jgi:UDP-glucose 4-epimerase
MPARGDSVNGLALRGVKVLVTGGAGFVGSHLARTLLHEGAVVTVYDNLSMGRRDLLQPVLDHARLTFVEADVLDVIRLGSVMDGQQAVFHLAANSDISRGREDTSLDLTQGTVATYNVLEAMRRHGVRDVVFASTSTVYGDARGAVVSEDDGPLLPISLYGASKLASEALVSAFCHNFAMRGWIFRFANVVGDHATHGVVYDFVRKLRRDSTTLEILGDGRQAKPYIDVDDCVAGMLAGWQHAGDAVNYFNLGCEGAVSVTRIAEIVVEAMGLRDVAWAYTGGERGWPGDVPQVRLCSDKLRGLGWKPRYDSEEALRRAARACVQAETSRCRP